MSGIVNKSRQGEDADRVKKRGAAVDAFAQEIYTEGNISGASDLGAVRLTSITRTGKPLQHTNIDVVYNTRTDGRNVTTNRPPFTDHNVVLRAESYDEGANETIIGFHGVKNGRLDGDPKFYKATWDAKAGNWRIGEEVIEKPTTSGSALTDEEKKTNARIKGVRRLLDTAQTTGLVGALSLRDSYGRDRVADAGSAADNPTAKKRPALNRMV